MCGPHKHVTVINSHCVGYMSVDLSWKFILLATQPWIGHRIHVYYMIKLFNNLFILNCIKFCIFCFIWNLRYTEYQFILMGFTWYPQVDNWIIHQFSAFTYPLNMRMVHRHINSFTLTHNTTRGKLLKGHKIFGGYPYLFQGCVNLSKWNSQIRIFSLLLS